MYTSCGYSTVIFDLDGTLVDSLPDLLGSLNALMTENGRRALDGAEVRHMVGDGAAKLVERAFAATGPLPPADALAEQLARFLDRYQRRATALTRPFPGAIVALSALRRAGVRLGVCTNKPAAATAEVLSGLGLAPYFTCVIGGDTIPGRRKPDPAPIRACLEALHAAPEAAILVGDGEADVAAARAAGIAVIACSFGYARIPVAELGADAVIDHFADLADAMVHLGQRQPARAG